MSAVVNQQPKKLSLWQLEVLRFKKKGLTNSLIALSLYLPVLYFWYEAEKYLWFTFEDQIQMIPPTIVLTVGASLLHTLTALLCLLVLLPTYRGEPSWLDKHRVPVTFVVNCRETSLGCGSDRIGKK